MEGLFEPIKVFPIPSKTQEKIIERLSQKEITLDEIVNFEDALFLLDKRAFKIYFREYKRRSAKYEHKFKGQLDDIQIQAFDHWLRVKILVEEAVKAILSYYNIVGSVSIVYHSLAMKVIKIIKRVHPRQWERTIKKEIEIWKVRYNADEKILRATALAAAKIAFRHYYHTG